MDDETRRAVADLRGRGYDGRAVQAIIVKGSAAEGHVVKWMDGTWYAYVDRILDRPDRPNDINVSRYGPFDNYSDAENTITGIPRG